MDIDEALSQVGGLRRFQLFIFFTLGFSCMVPTGIDSMMLVFVGWTPPHHCQQYPTNMSNVTEEYQEGLDSCHLDNDTHVCPYGWVYDANPSKEWSIVSEWDLVCGKDYLSELTEILAASGSVLGLLIFSPLTDRFGRKPIYIVSTAVYIVITVSMALTSTYVAYFSLRFLSVIINEAVISGAIMLIELFSTEHRTFAGIGLEFVWVAGYLYLALLYYTVRQWRHFLLVTSVPWVIFLSFIWILPESVPWLVTNGRIDDAIKALKLMAKGNGVTWEPPDTILLHKEESEMNMMVTDDTQQAFLQNEPKQEENTQKTSFCRKVIILITDKYTRRHFFISALLWLTNIWVYYGIIFAMPSIAASDKYLSFTMAAIAEIPAYILCLIIVRYGRRLPTILFHLGAGAALLLATGFHLFNIGGRHQHIFLMIFSVVGKFCVTSSFAIIILYVNELFPTSMRSTGSGLSKCIGRIGTILAPFIGYLAKKKAWVATLILGVMSVVTGLVTILLPETCHAKLPNTMEDIHDLYRPVKQSKPATPTA